MHGNVQKEVIEDSRRVLEVKSNEGDEQIISLPVFISLHLSLPNVYT